MSQDHNLVPCNQCSSWDIATRRKNLCSACNNSQFVPDPYQHLCHQCGENMHIPSGYHQRKKHDDHSVLAEKIDNQYNFGLSRATVQGQYSSYYLLDMTQYTFSLCEKCLRQMFMGFKIPPQITDFVSSDNARDNSVKWQEDLTQYEWRLWKDAGGMHQAYLEKRCNAIKDCPNQAAYSIWYDGEFSEDCCCEEHKDGHGGEWKPFVSNELKAFL